MLFDAAFLLPIPKSCTDGRAAPVHRGDNTAVSRLWEDQRLPTSLEWFPHTDDLDLRDVVEALPISVRSSDSSVVLTVFIDTQTDVVELTLSYSAARRVAIALVLATRTGV